MQETQVQKLDEFVDMRTLLPIVQQTFPTESSFRWFVRAHRDELADRGALINITGRLRFHPDQFNRAAVEIGRTSVLRCRR